MIGSFATRRAISAAIRSRGNLAVATQVSSVVSTNVTSSNTFSTQVATDENTVFMPPNLIIDDRTSASPFAGLEPLDQTSEQEAAIDEGSETEVEYDDDEDDNEGTYFSLQNQAEPIYVTPLPERLHVPIIDFATAEESGSIHLDSHVFGQDPIRTDILHRCVVYQRNKARGKRNGGAKTKTISEVSGSGKKVRNQKGGGIARAGHKRPAHWRGGAKAHGPKGQIQNYETKLNKKVKKMGLRMALSQKLKEGNLILVNDFNLGTYKTKEIVNALQNLAGIGGKEGASAFILDHVEDNFDESDEEAMVTSLDGCDINLKVGCSNVFRTKVANYRAANVYDVLKYEKLVLSLSALEQLEARYDDA